MITYNIFTEGDGSFCGCDRLKYYGNFIHFRYEGYWYAIPYNRAYEIVRYDSGNWFTNMLKSLKEKRRNEDY